MARPTKCENAKVIIRYVSAAIVAILLTIATPRTKLWNQGEAHEISQSYATLNGEVLLELITVATFTFISFFAVQGSDPGYLTSEIMSRACDATDAEVVVSRTQSKLSLLGDFGTAEMHMELEQSAGDDEDEALISSSSLVNGKCGPLEESVYKSRLRLYCPRCKFAPPIRAHHCKHCDVCVATFDHHCQFIGTCIGERNHCRFWWFITLQMISLFIMVSIVNSKKKDLPAGGEEMDSVPTIVMVVFSSLYIWPLTFAALMMWLGHTWFAITNSTSFEFMKWQHLEYLHGTKECDLPFSKVSYSTGWYTRL